MEVNERVGIFVFLRYLKVALNKIFRTEATHGDIILGSDDAFEMRFSY